MDNVPRWAMYSPEYVSVEFVDQGMFVIKSDACGGFRIEMSEAVADKVCVALGQLLTDRSLRHHGSLISKAAQLPDQVERAELLADAPPPSAADMSEGELILGRRVPRGDEVAAARELVANRPCTCTIDACGLRMCARCVALRR